VEVKGKEKKQKEMEVLIIMRAQDYPNYLWGAAWAGRTASAGAAAGT
jgi:hypothetical protein